MISVGIRELKNNLSRYIRRVEAGERVVVTDRGRVVAELGPPARSDSPRSWERRYQELVDAGLLRPALEQGDPFEHRPTFRLPPGTAAALIDEDRDDR